MCRAHYNFAVHCMGRHLALHTLMRRAMNWYFFPVLDFWLWRFLLAMHFIARKAAYCCKYIIFNWLMRVKLKKFVENVEKPRSENNLAGFA